MLVISGVRKAGQSLFAENKQDSEKFTKDHLVVCELTERVAGVDAEEALFLQHSVTSSTYVETIRLDGMVEEKEDSNGDLDLEQMFKDFRKKWLNKELKTLYGFDIPVAEITGGEFNTIKFVFADDSVNSEAQTRHIVGRGTSEEKARAEAINKERTRLIRAKEAGVIELLNKGVQE